MGEECSIIAPSNVQTECPALASDSGDYENLSRHIHQGQRIGYRGLHISLSVCIACLGRVADGRGCPKMNNSDWSSPCLTGESDEMEITFFSDTS